MVCHSLSPSLPPSLHPGRGVPLRGGPSTEPSHLMETQHCETAPPWRERETRVLRWVTIVRAIALEQAALDTGGAPLEESSQSHSPTGGNAPRIPPLGLCIVGTSSTTRGHFFSLTRKLTLLRRLTLQCLTLQGLTLQSLSGQTCEWTVSGAES